jgi:hypothetical protein
MILAVAQQVHDAVPRRLVYLVAVGGDPFPRSHSSFHSPIDVVEAIAVETV